MSSQFNHTLSFGEIESMRKGVLTLLSTIERNKYRMLTQDFNQLNNHLRYSLNILGNMTNILTVEKSDPYSSGSAGVQKKTVVYNADGTTKIIDSASVHTTGEEWEQQFDAGLLMNPPCYSMPPQSLTSIPHIKRASGRN
jgi:hypothetical protein